MIINYRSYFISSSVIPGTGKTHMAIAIGIKALLKGHKVLFTSVSQMLRNLNASKADNSYYQKVNYYLKPDLLILDELGFKKLPNYSADDFFKIISKRTEKMRFKKRITECGNFLSTLDFTEPKKVKEGRKK
ncbi:MAG: ATP-binding protein [Elusimicrobiota bacterium]|nr:ATP-binding protein [Elusimicrobiota bacterium]